MRLIKRYPNRKLYDTEYKKYVTLNDISGLIREGYEVQVMDHSSGEDLTAVTLTQIIFEQEKRQAGFLPRSVLTGLVRAGGEKLSTLRRTLALPLELLHHVDEEIDQRMRTLIRHGELEEAEGMRLRDKLLAIGSFRNETSASELREKDLERMLVRYGVPSRSEIHELGAQLESVIKKVDTMLDDSESI